MNDLDVYFFSVAIFIFFVLFVLFFSERKKKISAEKKQLDSENLFLLLKEDTTRGAQEKENEIKYLNKDKTRLEDEIQRQKLELVNIDYQIKELIKQKASLEQENKNFKEIIEKKANKIAKLESDLDSERIMALKEGMSKIVDNKFAELHRADKERLEQSTTNSLKDFLDNFQKGLRETEISIKNVNTTNKSLSDGIRAYHDSAEEYANIVREYNSMLIGEKRKNSGQIGESIIEDILESSGFKKGIHYEHNTKHSLENDKRPDFVVNLPGSDKKLIIDAKTLSSANEAYVESIDKDKNEKDKRDCLKKAFQAIDSTIKDLTKREYYKINDSMVEMILMFVPYPDLAIAYNTEKRNFIESSKSNVLVVCTSNLILSIRTMEYFYKIKSVESNFKKMQSAMENLYNDLSAFTNDVNNVSRAVDKLSSFQSSVIKKIKDNVVPSLRKFVEIGAISRDISSKRASTYNTVLPIKRKTSLPEVKAQEYEKVDCIERNSEI